MQIFNTIKKFSVLPFLVLTLYVSAQDIPNPSLEGEPQMHVPPDEWVPCKINSTPDTHPGVFFNYFPASHGESYMGMVTRGNGGENMNSTESCGVRMSESLHTGSCYLLQVDLYMSTITGHFADWLNGNWQSYALPVMFKVWGGSSECSHEVLLGEIGPISNTYWETYEIGFSTDRPGLQYLILEVDWFGEVPYFGNCMVDNLKMQRFDMNIDLGPNETLCESETRLLDVSSSGASNYLWQDGSTDPVFEVKEPGVYWVEVSNDNCKTSDTVVYDYKECKACNLFVQSLFAPNSDTPVLFPKVECDLITFNMKIFNMAGQLVYETDDYYEGWDGRAGMLWAPTGMYLYMITYYADDWGELKNQVQKGKIVVFEDR